MPEREKGGGDSLRKKLLIFNPRAAHLRRITGFL